MYRVGQEQSQKEYVTVSLIGDKLFKGIIFDSGSDIIVLFNGEDFIYIPVSHIEYIVADTPDAEFVESPNFSSILLNNLQKDLSLDSILKEAKGIYQELCVINKKSLHGTILDVLDDYIVFYSPIYKKIYIAKRHVKWLIPYMPSERPYNLSEAELNWQQAEKEYLKYYVQQIAQLTNKLVVINLSEKIHHIGKIKNISDTMLELQTARAKSIHVNIAHIQTIHEV